MLINSALILYRHCIHSTFTLVVVSHKPGEDQQPTCPKQPLQSTTVTCVLPKDWDGTSNPPVAGQPTLPSELPVNMAALFIPFLDQHQHRELFTVNKHVINCITTNKHSYLNFWLNLPTDKHWIPPLVFVFRTTFQFTASLHLIQLSVVI